MSDIEQPADTAPCSLNIIDVEQKLSRNAGTALPVGDPAGGSLDLKSDTSLLGLVNTVVK